MKNIDENELMNTYGGDSITGTLVNALVDGVKALFDVGRSLGFSLRRLSGNDLCPLQ